MIVGQRITAIRIKDKGRNRLLALLVVLCSFLFSFTSCDVHEFPDTLPTRKTWVHIVASSLEMTLWEQNYSRSLNVSAGSSVLEEGTIRYVIRAYPIINGKTSIYYSDEWVFVRNLADGYENVFDVDMPAGEYSLMVWADLSRDNTTYFYDVTDFANITLMGEHAGNTDYRDAFRGYAETSIPEDFLEHAPDTIFVDMVRPLAKFEFITTDIQEFIDKELRRIAEEGRSSEDAEDSEDSEDSDNSEDLEESAAINFEDYTVVFNYVGYMPNSYNIFTDKPNNSATGVLFESRVRYLNAQEGSMGFDYVFVNGQEGSVTVRLSFFDKNDLLLANSQDIRVPLKRNHHTIIRGEYLTSKGSGGIVINPEYEGDHNVVIP